jgi:hypothetical protein
LIAAQTLYALIIPHLFIAQQTKAPSIKNALTAIKSLFQARELYCRNNTED